MSQEEWARYSFKFDRCLRLEPKLGTIRKEVNEFWRKHVQNIGHYQTSQERREEAPIKDLSLKMRKLLLSPAELRSDVIVKYFDGAKSGFLNDDN